jgi:hypothetical protein
MMGVQTRPSLGDLFTTSSAFEKLFLFYLFIFFAAQATLHIPK